MSLLSLALLVYSMGKLAKHGVNGFHMHVDLTEELMELAVCIGIFVEITWALRLIPLRIFVRVFQFDICIFVMAALSAAFASANLAIYLGFGSFPKSAGDIAGVEEETESEEFFRGASFALLLFRFLLQPARAFLAMRNAWQLSREREVAMEDIILPEAPSVMSDYPPPTSMQMIGQSKGGFLALSSEKEVV
jgi:hypothetical protein